MKKFLFAFIGMFIMVISSNAQVKLGITASYQNELGKAQMVELADNRGYQIYSLTYAGEDSRFSYGLSAYADNDLLYFMTGIEYMSANTHYTNFDHTESIDGFKNATVTRQSIRIPISAGLKAHKFRVGVGPHFDILLDTEENLSEIEGITNNDRTLQTGFHFEVGYDPIPNIKLTIGYDIGFYNQSNTYKYNGRSLPFTATPKHLNFSAAIFM